MGLRLWILFRGACICPLFWADSLCAQDTLQIEAVQVNARKSAQGGVGRKTEIIDSAFRDQFRYNMVSDVLGLHSGAQLRTYGAGGIALAGLRGASSEQTAVLWNGVNLQNTMLGLTDLSMVPNVLFEKVAVEYGSSAAMWGGGAVGGSVHLDNAASFGRQFRVSAGLATGDIGQFNTTGVIRAGNSRIVNVTKLYTASSRNSYRFYHTGDLRIDTMRRAAFQGHGLMNDLRVRLGSRQVISVSAWLSAGGRQIPGYYPRMLTKQFQDDAAMRLQGAWIINSAKARTQFRSAYFNEAVSFTDSLAGIFNRNRAETMMLDVEQFLEWGGNHQLHAGVSMLNAAGRTENYEKPSSSRRISLLAGNRFSLFSGRLLALANARAEYFSAGSLPVTGNLGLEWRPFVWMKGGMSLNTAYRQPTLNELYWRPGGNQQLKPERSGSAEAHITLSSTKENVRYGHTLAAYTRTVADWIIWSPGVLGQPTPMNIQKVWSRGAETTWWADYKYDQWSAGLRLVTSYVLSTVLNSYSQSSSSVGKQLIYTPRYLSNGHLYAGYRSTRVYMLAQYAGYRFTTSDNSAWLDPYLLLSLRATQEFNAAGLRFTLFAACNNLLDAQYTIIDGRWMPLRHYEFGITIHFNKNQTNEKVQRTDK